MFQVSFILTLLYSDVKNQSPVSFDVVLFLGEHNQANFGSKLADVQHRYKESFSVPLVHFDFFVFYVFFDNFITNFWNPTKTSTSEHIFDIVLVDIKTEVYFIQYISKQMSKII